MKLYLPLLLVCAGAAVVPLSAQQRTMVINTGSSETRKFDVSPQMHIRFSDDQKEMIITEDGTDLSETFDIDELVNIVFTIDSEVQVKEQSLDDLIISHSRGRVTISGPESIEYSVWDLSGTQIFSGKESGMVSLDLSGLPGGIYIIKANDKTIKFINH